MNKTLQTLEIKVENNGATPQGKIFAREWNVLVEAVKALDLKEFDEAKLLQFLRDNDFITSEDIPDIDFSNVVTLSGQQTISGAKDFVGGIKVNGMPITYNAELGVWEFTGDLFVSGNFAWGASIVGFKPSTVMDAVRVDGSTIIKKKDSNGDWYLYAPDGSGGGSGGGLTLGDVVSYLSDNDYTTKTDVDSHIASSLAGYATEQWVANKGYLTSSALNGLASQSWVGDNYLAKSGGALEGVLELNSTNAARSIRFNTTSGSSWLFVNSGEWYVTNIGWGAEYKIIHSGNIGSYNAGSATKLQTPRTIWGQSFDGTEKITHGFRSLYADSYNGGVAHSILNNQGSPYGLLARIFANGSVSLQAQREANDAECFNLLLNHLGGNVAIGGTTADAKLHVYGGAIVDGSLDTSKIYIEDASRPLTRFVIAGSLHATVGYETNFGAIIQSYKGGNYFLLKDDNTAFLSCSTTINGNLLTTGNIEGGIFGLRNSSLDNPLLRLTVGNQNYYVQATSDGIYLGPTSTLSLKVDANGNTTINGNLLVNGNVSWFSHSQRSLKNIVSEQGLSLAQLERIKPIKFYWKDGRDMVLHVGGVADVFAEVLPEVVTLSPQDILCLNYVDAAFYVGASLIAPVLDHERRITKGEAEQEALKEENAKLKRELEEVKSKLNQLVA